MNASQWIVRDPAVMLGKPVIVCDPGIMLGKPIIKGTRITVELLIQKIAEGYTVEEILEQYPQLIREQVLAALEYED